MELRSSTWPKVCILWAAMSVSAYAEEVQAVTDVCAALRPCIVKLNAVKGGRVVSCKNGVVSYTIQKYLRIHGYRLGQFRLPDTMPLLPGLEKLTC